MSGSVEDAWAQWRDQNIYLDRDRPDSKMIAFKAGYASAINNKFSFAGWRWRPFGGCWTFANSEEEAISYAKKYNGVYEPLSVVGTMTLPDKTPSPSCACGQPQCHWPDCPDDPCDATFLARLKGGWQRRLAENEYDRLLAIAMRANPSLVIALSAMKAEWEREQRDTAALGTDPSLIVRAGKVRQRIEAAEVLIRALLPDPHA